jgi:hypothetical protein
MSIPKKKKVEERRQMEGAIETKAPETAAEIEPMQGFAPTNTKAVLHIPAANRWHYGASVNNQYSKGRSDALAFNVLRNERVGRTRGGDPIFRAVLGDEHNQVVAVIIREIDYRRMKDLFMFYSVRPEWPGHQASTKHSNEPTAYQMYPFASLEQSSLGKNYRLYSCKDHELLMEASNPKLRFALLCCMCCMALGAFRWKLAFHKPRHEKTLVLRNQTTDEVTVEPGTSPLLAVCMSYALDRLTIPTL